MRPVLLSLLLLGSLRPGCGPDEDGGDGEILLDYADDCPGFVPTTVPRGQISGCADALDEVGCAAVEWAMCLP